MDGHGGTEGVQMGFDICKVGVEAYVDGHSGGKRCSSGFRAFNARG